MEKENAREREFVGHSIARSLHSTDGGEGKKKREIINRTFTTQRVAHIRPNGAGIFTLFAENVRASEQNVHFLSFACIARV